MQSDQRKASPETIVAVKTLDNQELRDKKDTVLNIQNNDTIIHRNQTATHETSNDVIRNDQSIISRNHSNGEDDKRAKDEEIERRLAEINAAIRSLKTNLIFCSAFLILFFSLTILSDPFKVIIASIFKCLVPLLTTIANFVKILDAVSIYWENFVFKIQRFYSFWF
jgi:hypothetical protein